MWVEYALGILAHIVKGWGLGVDPITETKRKVFRFHETKGEGVYSKNGCRDGL